MRRILQKVEQDLERGRVAEGMDQHNLPHIQKGKNGRSRVAYIHSYMFHTAYEIYANILNEKLKREIKRKLRGEGTSSEDDGRDIRDTSCN